MILSDEESIHIETSLDLEFSACNYSSYNTHSAPQ